MNEFDQAARYAAKLDPAGFFRWLLAEPLALLLVFRDWMDTRRLPFPGERDRTCDTVARLQETGSTAAWWVLVVEFLSEPDPVMPPRLLHYQSGLILELETDPATRGRYRVWTALLTLTGPPRTTTINIRWLGTGDLGLHAEPVSRTMRNEPADATLAGIADGTIARCILPWVPLMRGADDPGLIERWKEVAGMEPDSMRRGQYADLALVFADLADRAPAWQSALKGWDMKKSMIVEEWRQEARAEGRAEAMRGNVRRALELRFQTPVPADLAQALEAVTDLGELQRWFDATQTSGSLADFTAAVRR